MLNTIRLAIGDFLNIMIFSNSYVWLNVWSIIHLIFGFLIMWLLFKYKVKNKFIWFLGILVFYEVLEFMFYTYWFTAVFIVEEMVDIVWDIIIGMFGGVVAWLVLKNK